MGKIPRRPYLLRALIDWIVDSGQTPYVLVDAAIPGVVVPPEHVKDGRIVLNLSSAAVRGLEIGRHAVSCDGRFGGRPFILHLPMASIIAVYARETGEGMVFEPETFGEPEPPAGGPTASATGSQPRATHLKRVK